MKNAILILTYIILISGSSYSQSYQCPYFPMELGKTWVYSSDDFPDSLISAIVDTATINNYFYYAFSPYQPEITRHIYWLRPEPRKIFALNLDDSTEYLLFDFDAQPGQHWEIPPVLTPFNVPVNQCDWGSLITLFSNSDTVFNSNRIFIRCYLFAHYEPPCYDAGISNTSFSKDFGIVAFSQITEGGVLDWELVTEPADTITLLGSYSIIGNPCLTVPCIPGVVKAVSVNDTNYVLTVKENFVWNGDLIWGEYTPEHGDSILVEGIVTERIDCNGKEYLTCEVLNIIEYIPMEIPDKPAQPVSTKDILFHNYPNPFNPETKIEYVLANPGNVKIILYDIQGREIKHIIDEYQLNGHHDITIDGRGLPSGIYYYQLITNSGMQSRSMILVR